MQISGHRIGTEHARADPMAAAASIDPAAHRALAAACRALGNELEARVEDCAAGALESGEPLLIYNLATVYFMAGHRPAAAKWYELALMLDPDLAIARRNLATIRFDEGRREEARMHWHRAYTRQCVFVSSAPQERRRILVLAASGYGNVPLKWLLPQHVNTQIQWVLEYGTAKTAGALPNHDLVFNAIGDPDVEGPTLRPAREFQRASKAPFLNHPAAVSLTRRDRLPGLLAGIAEVDVPSTLRADGIEAAARAVAQGGLTFPLLLRPAASHGGEGLVKLDGMADLDVLGTQDADVWYVSPFRDYRSPDGYWRKYRVIFIDRKPYPYHLAISTHWLVHYATADMLAQPGKCAEERKFLEDPGAVLGTAGMTALRAIGKRLDLDYAGVDFTVLPNGRLLVFEANATMLVHPEQQAEFAYKNPAVHRIVEAFGALLDGRIASARAGRGGCAIGVSPNMGAVAGA